MTPGRGHFVSDLTWRELECLAADGCWSLLPIGAGSKEHGKHLPLGTDRIQVDWLCNQLIEELPLLVWPVVDYGHYPAFSAFPGDSSLSEPLFENLVDEISARILRHGTDGCILLNSGISTIPALNRLAARKKKLHAWHIYSGECFQETTSSLCEQSGGGHADEAETSLMLHIASGQVNMDQCRDESSINYQPGPLNRGQPGQANYTASGAMGNPTLANAAKGKQLAQAIIDDASRAIMRFMNI